jgi:UMF1 family MFS transporter
MANNSVATAVALNNPRIVRAWYMYDWANSVYSLVITSSIFPIYYKAVTTTGDSDLINFFGFTFQSSVLYSYALSFSFLVVAMILPFLSGVADYAGRKKAFMKFFVWMGGLSCVGLFFFDDVTMLWWGILCSVLASIGYSGSLVFYNAFLPEIVTEDRYDAVSARGFSMGYYGSVILMIICLMIIMNYQAFAFSSEGSATRFTFLLVGAWWIGFSMIPFAILQENGYNRRATANIWSKGYQEISKVWKSLKTLPDLKRFLLAFFFYNSGVQTIMYLATLFGTDVLKLESSKLILTILIIQLVGALGAWLFSKVSLKRGNQFALIVMLIIWCGVCVGSYFITTEYEFYGLATIVGLIMGGIQSLSRATYSKLMPEDTHDNASYFSFYDVTYNVSIVIGTFSYGFIDHITGNMRYSALFLTFYFLAGMVFLLTVRSRDIRGSR